MSKQLPGKGVEYIVYDAQDRPVLMQDAKMRADNKALKTVYDAHSRVIETGFITATAISTQTALNDLISSEISEVLSLQYYDNYSGLTDLDPPTPGPTHGLPTWSKTRVLSTDHWITTVTGYDIKGRMVYTATDNPELDVVETQTHVLDFVGRITQTTTTHTKGGETLTWVDDFVYDTNGRLLTQKER